MPRLLLRGAMTDVEGAMTDVVPDQSSESRNGKTGVRFVMTRETLERTLVATHRRSVENSVRMFEPSNIRPPS